MLRGSDQYHNVLLAEGIMRDCFSQKSYPPEVRVEYLTHYLEELTVLDTEGLAPEQKQYLLAFLTELLELMSPDSTESLQVLKGRIFLYLVSLQASAVI